MNTKKKGLWIPAPRDENWKIQKLIYEQIPFWTCVIICRDLWLSIFTSDLSLSIVFIIQDFDRKDSSLLSLTFLIKSIAYLLETSTSFSLHGGNFSLINFFDTKFSRFTSALKRDHYFFLETGPGFWASVLRRLDERTNARNVSFIYLRWKLHPCQILSTSKSAKYISWCLWTTSLIYSKQIVLVLDIRLHSRLQLFQSPFRFFDSHFNPLDH